MRLDWVPATDRPDLLAEPVRVALERLLAEGVLEPPDVEVAEIDPDLADTAELVEASGLPMDDMANCIVIAGQRGGEERVCAALVLGTTRADVNRTVRKALDVRKCSFLAMDEAVGRTGMEYGGITPLGLPAGWRVLVDEAVPARGSIIVGSGLRRSKLRLAGTVAARLPGAEVVPGLGLPV
ncbi:YbaK/EbsC family protein [Ornithinimicrobium humiphilum]|uniref:Prolyl-tRNA editing enzyme YbaK/EbsC (Cys-tRNA(Pro) deacylase) n=1 Tax=Ornithinimicrobium humiphilum TaxID=125288 RepID=A0A543KPC1_9MICO|nr:YbaK/EbsC family protein [Ornithinimicrobium humiphilum]TQM96918.1 prolyl-tRNA editing enzyme YbaK/EbsC (Cys-tRNA(Pro) deacylase) [Ornithinimicrobium humiphilum]